MKKNEMIFLVVLIIMGIIGSILIFGFNTDITVNNKSIGSSLTVVKNIDDNIDNTACEEFNIDVSDDNEKNVGNDKLEQKQAVKEYKIFETTLFTRNINICYTNFENLEPGLYTINETNSNTGKKIKETLIDFK